MNPSLLIVVAMPREKSPPVMLENVPVASWDCAPFLITSSRSLMWIESGETLRVGVRQCTPADLFRSIVEAVAERGAEEKWGNVLSPTDATAALEYLQYFDLEEPELLYGRSFNPSSFEDISRVPVEWLPPSWGVLVPTDRGYVGTVYDFGLGHVAGFIHNASRSIVVLREA